jgi:hypothetical protein
MLYSRGGRIRAQLAGGVWARKPHARVQKYRENVVERMMKFLVEA